MEEKGLIKGREEVILPILIQRVIGALYSLDAVL